MGQQSSLVADDALGRSQYVMTDITFETHEGGGTSINLVDLWVMETPGEGQAKSYPLTNASPGRWEVNGFIEILADTDAIDCIIKSDEEEDVGFLHLDMKEIRGTGANSDEERSREMEIFVEQAELNMRWKGVVIPSEKPQVEDDVAAQLNDYAWDQLYAFEQTGNLSALAEAISCLRQAVDVTPEGHSKLPVYLCHLGVTLMRRFKRMGKSTDISEAVAAQQKAADLIPEGHANLPSYLANLGTSLTCRFEGTGELSDITSAIAAQQKAVNLAPQGHASLPGYLNNLGGSLTRRFERMGELADITSAIAVRQKAVDLTPQGHANLPSYLANLGTSLTCRFEGTGELSDITSAIAAQQKAVNIAPQGHASLPGYLNNLGGSLTRRFERMGELADITSAIAVRQKAVDLTPQGHANLPGYLNNLGNSLACRFERTGDLLDITNAIAVRQQAVNLTPPGHANLPSYLNNLGSSLTRRFERTGELTDITSAIAVLQKAADLAPDGHANLPGYLSNLGNSLTSRFERTGELAEITSAIAVRQKAVDLTPQGHANLPGYLNNLGSSLTRRFEQSGELTDITSAIAVLQKAADLAPDGHADLPRHLNNLGGSLTRRFERTGELADITSAIAVRQKAVDLTPQGHAELPVYLSNLGGSLRGRFERMGELTDITSAIAVLQKAADLAPDGHANLPGYLSNLGNSLTSRFERTGELAEITSAIKVLRKAVDLTPQGHPALPRWLSNLGGSLICRFERTGELSDIANAITVQEKAVDLTPQGHAELPACLNNLGNSLNWRFERTGELADITSAIGVQQKAVDLTPQGHADLPSYLNNLGDSLIRRFERTGELSDIENAITVQEKALDLTPQGHAYLPIYLTNLGNSLNCRFERTGELADITSAIGVQQKAVDLTPKGHADLPDRLNNLGARFYGRFGSSGKPADLEEAISCHKTAAMSTAGRPRAKLEAAHLWARTLIRHHSQSPEIIPAFDIAIGLVAIIAGLEQTLKGRYTQLESTSTLALEAAAAACALGRPDKALEWLEQGRCLVWNQLNNLRTPLDDLRIQDEILAQDIADVSKQLEHAGSSRDQSHADMPLSEKMTLEDEACSHLDLARRWDNLLRKARAIPGFESFLMPLPCSAIMQHLPESGPIVVININKRRCDALAVLAGLDEPLHIPLPNFSIETAGDYRAALDSRLRARQLRTREVEDMAVLLDEARTAGPRVKKCHVNDDPVHHVLRGLWEKVVKPILDGLGFSILDQSSRGLLPRLWWCPTGPLSFLPLHAAGIYQGSDSECVFDYVVSSYTPTVTSLTDRVKNHRSIDAKAAGLLLTSQPNAPGAPPIPGTTKEIRAIAERAEKNGVRAKVLEGNEISIEACLEEMKDFSSVHLACHGSQNAAAPLQSRFLFHQGSLELGTILKSNLKNADLAFLSACQTSTGQEKLADEAVHLAAGMLAAGYRRVIGTMWSIGDEPAQQVAITFYEYLFSHRDGTSDAGFDGTHSAIALHHATEKLRSLDNSEHSLLTWIPFVHFGY